MPPYEENEYTPQEPVASSEEMSNQVKNGMLEDDDFDCSCVLDEENPEVSETEGSQVPQVEETGDTAQEPLASSEEMSNQVNNGMLEDDDFDCSCVLDEENPEVSETEGSQVPQAEETGDTAQEPLASSEAHKEENLEESQNEVSQAAPLQDTGEIAQPVTSPEGGVTGLDKGKDSTDDKQEKSDEIQENVKRTLSEACEVPAKKGTQEPKQEQSTVSQEVRESGVNWSELYEYTSDIFLETVKSVLACVVVIVYKVAKQGRQHAHALEQRAKEAFFKRLDEMFQSLSRMVAQPACRNGSCGSAYMQNHANQHGHSAYRTTSSSLRGVSSYSGPPCCSGAPCCSWV